MESCKDNLFNPFFVHNYFRYTNHAHKIFINPTVSTYELYPYSIYVDQRNINSERFIYKLLILSSQWGMNKLMVCNQIVNLIDFIDDGCHIKHKIVHSSIQLKHQIPVTRSICRSSQ